jgi:hypothetical protein
MPPCQLYNNLDTCSLYRERLYGPIFKSLLTIIYATSPVLRSTAYTATSATYQLKSCIESLNALDITMLTGRQLTI